MRAEFISLADLQRATLTSREKMKTNIIGAIAGMAMAAASTAASSKHIVLNTEEMPKQAPRARDRATKKGMRHVQNPAGTKLARAASEGTLTKRHPSAVDSYFSNLYARRITAKNAHRKTRQMLRAA
jgi:hypothetical protein